MLPYLKNNLPESTVQTIEFKGYNANAIIGDGEFHDCKNLTSDLYPVLAPRLPRKKVKDGLTSATALYVRNGVLAWVDGTKFYYDGTEKGDVTEGEKQFVTMGDRIIIFPDKKMYDISDDEFSSLDEIYKSSSLVFTTNTITTTGEDFKFKVGDGIAISGSSKVANNKTIVVKSVSGKKLTFNDNSFTSVTETVEVTLAREVPDLEYVCEWNNRLWGVKDNTIYASALGKPSNFNVFSSLASDSYAIDVGSAGSFTGIMSFGSHICCFKETCIHRIYGSKPSNFQFSDSQSAGVKRGAYKSIVNISDNLIYMSPSGIVDYAGSVPESMASQFGTRRFSAARGGSNGKKYYVSLKEGNSWENFVYDFSKGVWLKEDDVEIKDFANDSGTLYILSNNVIYQIDSDNYKDEKVEWYAETGELSENADQKKIHTRFDIQCELLEAGYIEIEINQDRRGWKTIYITHTEKRTTLAIPIVPTRCNFLNIRIRGRGQARIYSLSRKIQMGSDLR